MRSFLFFFVLLWPTEVLPAMRSFEALRKQLIDGRFRVVSSRVPRFSEISGAVLLLLPSASTSKADFSWHAQFNGQSCVARCTSG